MALTKGVIARSMAMGMVVGFSPTVGLQMAICIAIAVAVNRLRGRYTFDSVIALIGSLVVNPLTMVPTYALYYLIGCRMLTCPAVAKRSEERRGGKEGVSTWRFWWDQD